MHSRAHRSRFGSAWLLASALCCCVPPDASDAESSAACGRDICSNDEVCSQCGDEVPFAVEPFQECQSRPLDCTRAQQGRTCGCDGQIYPSWCEARRAGAAPSRDACEPAEDEIRCGWSFCTRGEEYCTLWSGDVSDDNYRCVPLPTTCRGASETCDCLALPADLDAGPPHCPCTERGRDGLFVQVHGGLRDACDADAQDVDAGN